MLYNHKWRGGATGNIAGTKPLHWWLEGDLATSLINWVGVGVVPEPTFLNFWIRPWNLLATLHIAYLYTLAMLPVHNTNFVENSHFNPHGMTYLKTPLTD